MVESACDRVVVKGLLVEAVIGIHDWERKVRQPLRLELAVGSDVARVAAADAIELAVDYGVLAERVTAFIQAGEYRLLETLAEETAAMVLKEFKVPWLSLLVEKPTAVANAETVGVAIARSRLSG